MSASRANLHRRARRLVVSSFCLSACLTPPAFGLGLGAIELKSFLGQPLHAQIPLLGPGELSEDQIRVQLGSVQDYLRMQVERSFLHTRFELEPVLDSARPHILLTTREPVTEPFLNFVLNVRWPQGRFAREFTLLLDPPQPGAAAHIQRVSYDSQPAFTPAPAQRGAVAEGAVRTRRGDTLWGLAQRLRHTGMSLEQAMDAIVAANPHAFIAGDPDRLKAGVRIVLPATVGQGIAGNDKRTAEPITPAPAAADGEMQQSLVRLEQGVDELHSDLADTRARLQRMEAQLSRVIAGYQRLAGTGPVPAEAVRAPREDVLEDLRSLDVSKLPVSPVIATAEAQTASVPQSGSNWWLHGSYLALLVGAGLWLLRSRLHPSRPQAAVAAPSEREILNELAARQTAAPPAKATPAPMAPVTRSFANAQTEPEEVIDPLLEAGAYIAFAQYDRAEAVLRKAVDEQPERSDLKLQLLDVYQRSGQSDKLESLAEELAAGADKQLAAQARQYH